MLPKLCHVLFTCRRGLNSAFFTFKLNLMHCILACRLWLAHKHFLHLLSSRFNCMAGRVDINEFVALELNNTQNDFEFKKRVPVTTVPDVAASFLLITYAYPIAAGLGGGSLERWGQRFCCTLIYSLQLSEACSNKVFRASTPHALIGSHSAFRGGMIYSSTLCTRLHRVYRTALGRSRRRFLPVHTLTWTSSIKPLSLLVDWVQGSQLCLYSLHFSSSLI